MTTREAFEGWCQEHALAIKEVEYPLFELKDIGQFILIEDDDKEVIILPDFTLSLSDDELTLVEFELPFVFRLGHRFYFTDKHNSLKILPFRHLGFSSHEVISQAPMLGVHGRYELFSGSRDYDSWVKKAKFLQVNTLGLCEKETLAGALVFQQACLTAGIKPIIGESLTVVFDKRQFGVKFYVLSKQGWANLLYIHRLFSTKYFGPIPLLDLKGYGQGLVCCLDQHTELFPEVMSELKAIFKQWFFVQLDPVVYTNQGKELKHLTRFKTYVKEFLKDYPPVLIPDAYYLDKADAPVRKFLTQIGKVRVNDSSDQYFKAWQEVFEQFVSLFRDEDQGVEVFVQALENLHLIEHEADFSISTKSLYLPKYKLTLEEEAQYGSSETLFLDLIEKGIETKIVPKVTSELQFHAYIKRIDEEIKVIKSGGIIDYFLILWDLGRWCDEQGILRGPGRGSAAGSIICWLINITLVDPVEYNLLFERFLGKARLGVDEVPVLTLAEEVFAEEAYTLTKDNGETITLVAGQQVPVLRKGRVVTVVVEELVEGDVVVD